MQTKITDNDLKKEHGCSTGTIVRIIVLFVNRDSKSNICKHSSFASQKSNQFRL